MDTSEKYIRMCDCPEAQDQYRCLCGDYYYPAGDEYDYPEPKIRPVRINTISGHFGYRHHYTSGITGHGTKDKKAHVWLPRQGQIQEMLSSQSGLWIHKHNKFSSFVEDEARLKHDWIQSIDTQEKAWLVYFMYSQHCKIWDDEKGWVKAKLRAVWKEE